MTRKEALTQYVRKVLPVFLNSPMGVGRFGEGARIVADGAVIRIDAADGEVFFVKVQKSKWRNG